MNNVEIKKLRATILQQNEIHKNHNNKIRQPIVVFKGVGKKKRQFLFQMLHVYMNYLNQYKKKLEKSVKQKVTDKDKQQKVINLCLQKRQKEVNEHMFQLLAVNKKKKYITKKTIRDWAKILAKANLCDENMYKQIETKVANMDPDITLLPPNNTKGK